MPEVLWRWGPGASKALQSTARYVDLEGGVRAQKTTALCARALILAGEHPGMRLLLARYTDDATNSLLKPKWREYLDLCGVSVQWDPSESCDILPNGSRVYIHGLKSSNEAAKFSKVRGPTLAFVGVDQPEEMPGEFHGELVARISQPGYPQQLWYTPQPVNPGHWIATQFPTDNSRPDHYYVRTNCYDNEVNLGRAYIASLEEAYPEGSALRRTLLEGRRGLAVQGEAVYAGYFSRRLHVNDALEMVPSSPLIEAWDFGHSHPCVVWLQFLSVGRLQILGAVMGTKMFLEDFAPIVDTYRRQWCPNPLDIWAAGDPSALDSNNQGVRTTKVRDVLADHGIFPQSQPFANSVEAQFNAIQSVGRFMRRIALDGQPAFQVNPRAMLVSVEQGQVKHTPMPFVADAFEAGFVWSDKAALGMKAGIRQAKNDGLYDHGQRALNYGVIAFEPAQPTQVTLAKQERRELKRAQMDHDPADGRRGRNVRIGRGGY